MSTSSTKATSAVTSRARSTCRSAIPLAVRVVGYYTKYAGFIDAIGPAGGKDVNDGSRVGGRISLLWEPIADISITPRVVYQEVRADGFNREEVFNLYANQFTTTRPADASTSASNICCCEEKFKDETLLADLTASYDFGGVELTSVTSYINRDILVSRDASALTGSVSVDLGLSATRRSGFRRTCATRPTSRTGRRNFALARPATGPFQWVVGGFYSDVDRKYTQRLPTPGYDAFVDAVMRSARGYRRRRTSPTASGRTRPTTPTCPTTSSRRRCSARPAMISASSS